MRTHTLSRRQALNRAGALLAGSLAGASAVRGQAPVGTAARLGSGMLVPRADLVNVLEYEDQARRVLTTATQDLVTGSDRTGFDRITLRPRMLVPTVDLDLSVTLFGHTHFAPILVGPIARQRQYHPDGETATLAGATDAQAATIISSQSDTPVADLASQATLPLWYQVFAGDPTVDASMHSGVQAGCAVICVTIDAEPDWGRLRALVGAVQVPVVLKGVVTAAEALTAAEAGFDGVVVSEYGRLRSGADMPLILTLPRIVHALDGRVPILADGGFRRGTDIIKALAFGATAVLIGRPIIWGLAAYGREGVEGVIRMLQTELARYMAMSGRHSLATLDRTLLRVHEPLSRS
jgi:4-hydroxymandelate oxidase